MHLAFFCLTASLPQDHGFMLRVCDIGQGLACVMRMPDGDGSRYVVYDAGHWNTQRLTRDKINEVVPVGEKLDWFVLSHTDGDHIAAVNEVLEDYEARRIVWPDNPRDNAGWRNANTAIDAEEQLGALVFKPEDDVVAPGKRYRLGDGFIQFIFGKSKPPASWGLSGGPFNNAGSVVISIQYKGRRILLTGDAIGRELGGPANQCIASELEMVENVRRAPLKSDVIVAAHHGGDNASSNRFIREVKPRKVIFSAQSSHEHPTKSCAERYIALGLSKDFDIFRTDVGDHEGGYEWSYWPAALGITEDKLGRDDVDVKIGSDGTLSVGYRHSDS